VEIDCAMQADGRSNLASLTAGSKRVSSATWPLWGKFGDFGPSNPPPLPFLPPLPSRGNHADRVSILQKMTLKTVRTPAQIDIYHAIATGVIWGRLGVIPISASSLFSLIFQRLRICHSRISELGRPPRLTSYFHQASPPVLAKSHSRTEAWPLHIPFPADGVGTGHLVERKHPRVQGERGWLQSAPVINLEA